MNLISCKVESIARLHDVQSVQIRGNATVIPMENDYAHVNIPEDSVIFCDPPYKGTSAYSKQTFDSEHFYAWAQKQKNIYISEYDMPEDRFTCIWKKTKTVTKSAKTTGHVTEKLFIPNGNNLLYGQMDIMELLK